MAARLLHGRRYLLLGFPPAERSAMVNELSRLLAKPLEAAGDVDAGEELLVVTSYWADVAPPTKLRCIRGRRIEMVTRCWVRTVARLGRWVDPRAHRFFRPPRAPEDGRAPLVSYPVDFQVEADARDPRLLLPCSPRFLIDDEVPLWPYVLATLRRPLASLESLGLALQELMMWNSDRRFNCLDIAIKRLLSDEERAELFNFTLPELQQLVCNLPFLFPTSPPVLAPLPKQATAPTIRSSAHSFTKEEALALVACCFFSIMPGQTRKFPPGSEGGKERAMEFNSFSMVSMLVSPPAYAGPKVNKIRCVLQYFIDVVKKLRSDRDRMQHEIVTFSRVGVMMPVPEESIADGYESDDDSDAFAAVILDRLSSLARLQNASGELLLTHISSESNHLIEDLDAHLQIDFANMFPGGGVLGGGCVQEEIRFAISPEMLISCLMIPKLETHEAFAIRGSQRYCSYTGYGGSFEMSGPSQDHTPFEDVEGKQQRRCVTVGIDASDYGGNRRGSDRQFSRGHMWRDVFKAYVGFAYNRDEESESTRAWPVATGNWGCGVFRGDPELKLLLQWLASSLVGRDVVYVLLDRDEMLKQRLARVCELMSRLQWHVAVQWLAEFLFGSEGGLSLAGRVHRRREQQRRPGLRSRRGAGHDNDGNGSGVLLMAVESLEKLLIRFSSDTASSLDVEDIAVDIEATRRGESEAVDESAPSPPKRKRLAQSTMEQFFQFK